LEPSLQVRRWTWSVGGITMYFDMTQYGNGLGLVMFGWVAGVAVGIAIDTVKKVSGLG